MRALILGLILPLIATPALAQPSQPALSRPADTAWEVVQRRGRLRVGIDPSLGRAYLYTDPHSRTYRGFEWDILQAVGSTLKLRIQPVYIPWGEQLAALQRGEVDLILGARQAVGLDPQFFLATRPYYRSPQRLVVRADQKAPPERLSQLFGKKVGIVVDSTGAALLEVYNRERGNAIRLFATSDPEQLFDQLRQGQLDAVLIDQPVAVVSLADAQQSLMLVGPPLLPISLVGVVSADHRSLKGALDDALSQLQASGTLKSILEEWQLWDPAVMPPV